MTDQQQAELEQLREKVGFLESKIDNLVFMACSPGEQRILTLLKIMQEDISELRKGMMLLTGGKLN